MGFIYKITNNINLKNYIGQTTKTIEERWKGHLKKNSNCIYLKRSLDKYGIENFTIEELLFCENIMLNENEIIFIKKYNSIIPNGYNIKSGGHHHEETKEKIRKSLQCSHICINCDKIIVGGQHKTCSDKCRYEIKYKNSTIKVLQFDLNNNFIKEYDSYKEAAEKNNVSLPGISMVCNGKRKQLKGFIYKPK